ARGAGVEWWGFDWVINLICFAVLVVALAMSCTARVCSFSDRVACSDSRRIAAIDVAICAADAYCSLIARLTVAIIRVSASADLVICSADSDWSVSARAVVAAPRRIESMDEEISVAELACSVDALRTWVAVLVVACAALMMSRGALPCSPIALVPSRATLRI